MNYEKTIMITGGAGFIGSHAVRLFVKKYPSYRIINLDALTYAGNLENLKDVENAPNYVFERADINNEQLIDSLFEKYQAKEVQLSCFNENTAGLLLYPKLGFVPFSIEERPAPGGKRSALINMTRHRP